MNESRQSDPSSRPHKLRRGVAVAVAGPLLLAAACSSPKDKSEAAPNPTTTTEATTTSDTSLEAQRNELERQAKENLQVHAKDAAFGVLHDLDNPKAGTEMYDQYVIGNKAAVVGPDLEYPTADDLQYRNMPEMLARFYPDSGLMLIRSTAQHGEETEESTFYSVDTVFQVAGNDPITAKSEQLTTEDFRAALENATIVAASAGTPEDNAGIWVSDVGMIDNDSTAVYQALDRKLPDQNQVLDYADITGRVNNLTAVMATASYQIAQDIWG